VNDQAAGNIDPRAMGTAGTLDLAPGVSAPAGAVRMQFVRSGGPGGQNVNKLNTKAQLWIEVDRIVGLSSAALVRLRNLAGGRLTRQGEIHISAEAERSQEANRQEVLDRLREMIIQARIEPKARRKTRPSRASKQRRLESKRRRGQVKSSRHGGGDDDW
jgi:ribosome-associated protein